MTKISIVTPTLNSEAFLTDCLASVREQAEHVGKHIVVDGGSTDSTLQKLRASAWESLVVIEAPGTSASQAINIGLQAAAPSTALSVLNSDDFLYRGALDYVGRWMLSHPRADVLTARTAVVNSHGGKISVGVSDQFSAKLYARGLVRVVHPATFVRWHGPFNHLRYPEANATCWDGEYLVSLATAGARFAVDPTVVTAFRVHPAQISSSGNDVAYWQDRERLFRSVIGRHPTKLDRWVLRRGSHLRRALDCVRRGHASISGEGAITGSRV